jgi:Protein of unknown function (DUF3999)
MRKLIASSLLASVMSLLAVSADLPEQWRSWRYSRALQAPQASGEVPAEIVLPWEIYPHCRPGCEDVRLVNSRGEEIPFVVDAKQKVSNVESRAARILENSFVANEYTQVIGDLGEGYAPYDRVRVETNRADFIVWAEVALSDDAKTWRVVEARAPIARFRSRSVDGTQTIPFQGLSSRYVRVRIADPTAKFPAEGISVLNETEVVRRQTADVSASFTEEKSADQSESRWRTTLASLNQPVSELTIQTDSPEFYRAVRVSASSDDQEWSYWGSGVIYRYRQGDKTRESLRIEFPEMAGNQFFRVELINGNDQPLTKVRLKPAAVPRTLAFELLAGQSYRLIYGNEKAGWPQYDLGRYFDSGPAKPVLAVLSLGPEQETANYLDPRPFTERHPEVLWGALGLAIVLIGLTALKTLRAPGKPAASN